MYQENRDISLKSFFDSIFSESLILPSCFLFLWAKFQKSAVSLMCDVTRKIAKTASARRRERLFRRYAWISLEFRWITWTADVWRGRVDSARVCWGNSLFRWMGSTCSEQGLLRTWICFSFLLRRIRMVENREIFTRILNDSWNSNKDRVPFADEFLIATSAWSCEGG